MCNCVICPTCNGDGEIQDFSAISTPDFVECPTCEGEGILVYCDECREAEEDVDYNDEDWEEDQS